MTTLGGASWVVAHDGSSDASHAAAWALTQAAGRGVDLQVVRAWQFSTLDSPLPTGPNDAPDDVAPAQVSDDFDEFAAAAHAANVGVSSRVERGAARQTLLEASRNGSMLVVGSRGHGGLRRSLLGSVSAQCATHAIVPTVVVPHSASTNRRVGRIVVGIDGSERSLRALAWALDFASATCEVVALGAWVPSKPGFLTAAEHYRGLEAARADFDALLDEMVVAGGDGRFRRRFAHAGPATRLLEEAGRVDLVVVGQRAQWGLGAAILGSVSTKVLHRSPVPVVVVPDSG